MQLTAFNLVESPLKMTITSFSLGFEIGIQRRVLVSKRSINVITSNGLKFNDKSTSEKSNLCTKKILI